MFRGYSYSYRCFFPKALSLQHSEIKLLPKKKKKSRKISAVAPLITRQHTSPYQGGFFICEDTENVLRNLPFVY